MYTNIKKVIISGAVVSLALLLLTQERVLAQNSDASAKKASAPIEVLMITGGGPFHDYPTQKKQIEKGLTERIGNIDFTIDHNEGDSEEDMSFKFESQLNNDWAKEYDLVLYNNCNLDMGDAEHVEKIMGAHAEYEVPAVLLHCPMHLHRTTTEKWYNFTGAVSYQHEVDRTPFTVEALQPDHPIMANFPGTWRTPEGELYMPIELKDDATPIARAYGDEAAEWFPVAWTHNYKGVRVFSSTLGHHNATMGADVNLNLVAAGLLWADDKLKEDGTPEAGYSGDRGLGWISLWNGENLTGWRASETTDWGEMNWFDGNTVWPTAKGESTGSFEVRDGKIVADGPRSHLFYQGRINGGKFEDFEFKSEVYTHSGSDSGVFFHTRFKDSGYPTYGYEADINTVEGSGSKTGRIGKSRQGVDVLPHENEEFFEYVINVHNEQVTTRVNGEVVNEYTEDSSDKVVNEGVIAIQAESGTVYFRDLFIRVWNN